MPTDLEKDKKRSDNRYSAAKAIGKWLAKLPDEDRLIVLRHVAAEYKLDLIPLGPKVETPSKGDLK